MKKWEKIQNVCKSREIIGILGIIVSIIIGGICDWNVLIEGNILISIDDIESFSLTILQRQMCIRDRDTSNCGNDWKIMRQYIQLFYKKVLP
mgnify:CR=1 FL=1